MKNLNRLLDAYKAAEDARSEYTPGDHNGLVDYNALTQDVLNAWAALRNYAAQVDTLVVHARMAEEELRRLHHLFGERYAGKVGEPNLVVAIMVGDALAGLKREGS